MSFYLPGWGTEDEPDQQSIRTYMDNLASKFQPLEQTRWREGDIDTMFYAGDQRYVNTMYGYNPQSQWNQFYFNICQQPVNMVSGFLAQHRKQIIYMPGEGGDPQTTDQYTKVHTHAVNQSGLHEPYQKACEQSAIAGMVLLQPYLDYRDDPINGTLRRKVWSYNSFMIDPYFREPDASDANFIWCQQFISKREAASLYPEHANEIRHMSGTPGVYGRFYFLPENYNLARNDLLAMSYLWYKWKRKRKKIYSPRDDELFDFSGDDRELAFLKKQIPQLEVVEIEVPSWKLAVVINETMVWQGFNPLGFDETPMVPAYWNYDPHLREYGLRSRGLIRACRSSQYLFNRKVIDNNDIQSATINAGWYVRENAIANEEVLGQSGNGKRVIIKDEFRDMPIKDVIQKMEPSGPLATDIQLAEQMHQLIYESTGVQLENFGLGDAADKMQSALAIQMKQGAGLMVLQKYFDQWDNALKILGGLELKIIQNNWSASKVGKMIGEEPTPLFFNKLFAKTHVLVAEGADTITQKQLQYGQALELNRELGGILPPEWLVSLAPIQGTKELQEILAKKSQAAAAAQEQEMALEHTVLEAKLQTLYASAAAQLATARERHGRAESNIGLFEERLSEISHNRAQATKAKVESLEKLLDVIGKYGEVEAALKSAELQSVDFRQQDQEEVERADARSAALSNDFTENIMQPAQEMGQQSQPQGGGQASLGDLAA